MLTLIEDIFELAENNERLIQIEASETFLKSCTKETMALNLRYTVSEANEINNIALTRSIRNVCRFREPPSQT